MRIGREIARVQHLAMVVLVFVIGVDDGGKIAVDVSRIRGDAQTAGSAGREGFKLLQVIRAIHDRAVLVHVDGIRGQSLIPDLAIAGRDGVQKRLVLGVELCDGGVGGGGELQDQRDERKQQHPGIVSVGGAARKRSRCEALDEWPVLERVPSVLL